MTEFVYCHTQRTKLIISFGFIQTNKAPQLYMLQARYMSGERGGGRKGFLGELLDNIKQELSKNKEMKENIKKFREEAKKLEESDALKQARRKYVSSCQTDSSCFSKCLI